MSVGSAFFIAAIAWAAPSGAAPSSAGDSPAPAHKQDLAAGKLIYAQSCVVCHGIKGKGNGPSGKGLDPKPNDFTTATANDESWFKATKLGTLAVGKSKNMEAFGGKLSDDQIRDVLAYCKSFKAP